MLWIMPLTSGMRELSVRARTSPRVGTMTVYSCGSSREAVTGMRVALWGTSSTGGVRVDSQ